MHQDIEKLLNAAKEKGSITEKQRNLIIAKAQQLSEDMTEVEFMLEDIPVKKINEAQTPPPIPMAEKPKTNKHGEVKKCPQCGAVVQGFQGICSECGYVFENVESNQSVAKLMKLLADANEKFPYDKNNGGNMPCIVAQETIILNFPIPNTKTDLIDFMVFLEPRAFHLGEDPLKGSYVRKFQECTKKAKLLFPDDKDFSSILKNIGDDGIEFTDGEKKTIKGCIWGIIGFIVIIIIIFAFI